jgi:hypothetical protein
MKGLIYKSVQCIHTDKPQTTLLYVATVIFGELYNHKLP